MNNHIPTPVLTAIRAGWQYGSTDDPLEIVSVSAIPAGELASQHREGGGCAELADALAELPATDVVYDVMDGTSHAVYIATGAKVWALS